jgi:hypothetical protein
MGMSMLRLDMLCRGARRRAAQDLLLEYLATPRLKLIVVLNLHLIFYEKKTRKKPEKKKKKEKPGLQGTELLPCLGLRSAVDYNVC